MSNRIWDEKEVFIQKNYVREPELFTKIRQTAKEKNCDFMMVAPTEARMLQSLVEVHGSKKILEIGTLFGYTAIYLAQGIVGEGKVWTCELSHESAEIARSFISKSSVADKIEVVQGDAHENLKKLEQFAPFDCIFIDADKNGYPEYLAWAEKNVRKGGLVIADNTILGGSVWSTPKDQDSEKRVKNMMEFHKQFSDPKKFRSTIYASFDGIAVGVKV
jgi:predicted O-methyltransferase YrrM